MTALCLLSILKHLLVAVELMVIIPLLGMKRALSPLGWGESLWLNNCKGNKLLGAGD